MPSPLASLSAAGVKRLNEVIANAASAGDLPTFVFGATNLNQELYFNGHGPIDYHDAASPPAGPDSIYWICSMTKFIASVATLQLIDRALLTLDTPVSKFLPQFSDSVILQYPFKVDKPAFKPLPVDKPVTVLNLLNHSSGLYYELKVPEPWYAMPIGYTGSHDKSNPLEGFFNKIRGDFPGIPLKFEPGTSWTYGYSCDILGFLVQAVTGLTFEQYCQENIFKPLGIRASFYLTPSLKDDLVRLTYRNPDGAIVPWADQVPILEHDPEKVFAHLGGVGLYTSMRNYLTLLRHILRNKDDFPVRGARVLSRASAESLFHPTLTPRGSAFLDRFNMTHEGLQYSTGLALMGEDLPGMRKKGSGWWGGWAGTTFFLDPSSGIAVVFGSQMVPPGDEKVIKLQQDLERALYASLEYADLEARPKL
ncbi:beta-lactamase [Coprinellus micaceus]|uniref:Beta-lactamase n=1 Tax=Coprinellus micaceus TaxID=71717 RepID=A0A4Y7T000_COPMI|nr:beta-lactamase [Coprinellus micaceus]